MCPFAGRHQAYNAAVVVQAALALCEHGFDISDEAIMQGIAAARNPCAHRGVAAAGRLSFWTACTTRTARAPWRHVLRRRACAGPDGGDGRSAAAKSEAEMLRALSPYLARVYAVQPAIAARPIGAEAAGRGGKAACAGQVSVWHDVRQAVQHALRN